MIVWAIDPGSTHSALVEVTAPLGPVAAPPFGLVPVASHYEPNDVIATRLERLTGEVLAVEVIAGIYGGTTGRDQLTTERWAGRFIDRFLQHCPGSLTGTDRQVVEITRSAARVAATGTTRTTDSGVRRAILDLYGGDAARADGKCRACKGRGWNGRGRPPCTTCDGTGSTSEPGPFHGWTGSHGFAAMAVALAWAAQRQQETE